MQKYPCSDSLDDGIAVADLKIPVEGVHLRLEELKLQPYLLSDELRQGLALFPRHLRRHVVAAQLDAGTVWVNCSQPLWAETPFGGWKQSGFGRGFGPAGLLEYVKWETRSDAPNAFNYEYYQNCVLALSS